MWLWLSCHLLRFVLFSMCYSLLVAVNCSVMHFYRNIITVTATTLASPRGEMRFLIVLSNKHVRTWHSSCVFTLGVLFKCPFLIHYDRYCLYSFRDELVPFPTRWYDRNVFKCKSVNIRHDFFTKHTLLLFVCYEPQFALEIVFTEVYMLQRSLYTSPKANFLTILAWENDLLCSFFADSILEYVNACYWFTVMIVVRFCDG